MEISKRDLAQLGVLMSISKGTLCPLDLTVFHTDDGLPYISICQSTNPDNYLGVLTPDGAVGGWVYCRYPDGVTALRALTLGDLLLSFQRHFSLFPPPDSA